MTSTFRRISMIERMFRLHVNGTTVRTELIAGATTFLSMSYIIFLQPALLSQAGMDFGSVMMATCISSAIACLIMAFAANYPIALAPGMGENFYFVFAVVLGMGIPWQAALGAVFISGILFLILTLLRVREMVIDAVPENLKHAIPAAIGLLITYIGLIQAGIIVKDPGGYLMLGDLHASPTLLALGGLVITLFLMVRRIRGAMLLGILATAVIGLLAGVIHYQGIFSAPPSIMPTFLKLDIAGAFSLSMVTVIIIFLFMDMFDTIGTFIGVGQATGLMKEDGSMPRIQQALMADSIGTVAGSLFGTSTVTSYIESTTGVREGGRTGLTAVTVAALFLAAVFFSPVVAMIGSGYAVNDPDGALLYTLYPVTAPALILVGSFMARSLSRCKWDDLTEASPAFMTIVVMMVTNISHGLAAGFILYPLMKLLAGRPREVSWLMYMVAAAFLARYVWLGG